MKKTKYNDFLYVMKRYGYKDIPYSDEIFKHLCPLVGIDHSRFDNEHKEDKEDPACQVFKSSFIFQ